MSSLSTMIAASVMLVALLLVSIRAVFRSVAAVRRARSNALSRDLAAKVLMAATKQVEHEAHMIDARGKEAVSVRLVPQVPVRAGGPSAWFGGATRLPAGMPWPEIGGVPLQLLAQIDCSTLPAGLWDGLGPRRGWLAIFIEPFDWTLRVMHFEAVGPLVPGPALPPDSNIVGYDMRQRDGETPHIQAIPRWPVDVVPVFAGAGDPRRDGRCDADHRRYRQRHDILDTGLLPFDWPSVQAMMAMVTAEVAKALPTGDLPAFLTPQAVAEAEARFEQLEAEGASPDKVLDQALALDERRAMAWVRDETTRNGPVVLRRLEALKTRVDAMAAAGPFTAGVIAPVLAEMHGMIWTGKSVPPLYRDGRKLTSLEWFDEGVERLTLPLTRTLASAG